MVIITIKSMSTDSPEVQPSGEPPAPETPIIPAETEANQPVEESTKSEPTELDKQIDAVQTAVNEMLSRANGKMNVVLKNEAQVFAEKRDAMLVQINETGNVPISEKWKLLADLDRSHNDFTITKDQMGKDVNDIAREAETAISAIPKDSLDEEQLKRIAEIQRAIQKITELHATPAGGRYERDKIMDQLRREQTEANYTWTKELVGKVEAFFHDIITRFHSARDARDQQRGESEKIGTGVFAKIGGALSSKYRENLALAKREKDVAVTSSEYQIQNIKNEIQAFNKKTNTEIAEYFAKLKGSGAEYYDQQVGEKYANATIEGVRARFKNDVIDIVEETMKK